MELVLLLIVVILLLVVGVTLLGMAMKLLWALFIGAIIGAIAGWIVDQFQPAGGPRGCLSTALAGIGGSVLATIVFGRQGLLASILGAIIVVILWKLATAGYYARRG